MFNRTWNFAALLLAAAAPSQAVMKGDVAFTSFNADADGWSIVALAELAPNSTVYFTDNAWDSAAGLFVGSEGHHRWNSGPRPVTAGTVVNFTRTDSAVLLAASVGSLSRARVAGSSTYDLSQTAETLYAYVGGSATAPTEFLAALSTAGFSPLTGGLAGTGLAQGLNATALANGSDFADYAGPRRNLSAGQLQTLTASPALWTDLGDGAFSAQAVRLSAFEVTAVPEPGASGLALTGLAVLAAWRWHWWQHANALQRAPAGPLPRPSTPSRRRGRLAWVGVRLRLCLRSKWGPLGAAAVALAPACSLAATTVTRVVNLGALTTPVTLNFGASFNDLDPFTTGIQIAPAGVPVTLRLSDSFVEQYRLQVGAAEVAAIAGTIDLAGVLNVEALQLHLYGGAALPISTVGAGSALAGLTPLFSGIGGGEFQTLQGVALEGGTYVLEVRGQVAGTAGGSYAGVLNLSPVPEAGGWALSMAGLGVLLWDRRRRSAAPCPNGPHSAHASTQPGHHHGASCAAVPMGHIGTGVE